jgi:hypothetical protein
MAEGTLHQVQRLVEQLSPSEQAHLLVSLALRLAQVVTSTSSPAAITPSEPAAAWEEFFRLGDALAASDTPGAETLTAAVLAMRGNAMYTVDASVWVNAFDQREPGHQVSRQFLEVVRGQAVPIIVPN